MVLAVAHPFVTHLEGVLRAYLPPTGGRGKGGKAPGDDRELAFDVLGEYLTDRDHRELELREELAGLREEVEGLRDEVRKLQKAKRSEAPAGALRLTSRPTGWGRRKRRAPRFAVVGLTADQNHKLDERLEGKAEVAYLDRDVKHPRFPKVDYLILAGRFISHATEAEAREQLGPERVLTVKGGLVRIAAVIEELLGG